jgi:hypothetical protein
VTAGVRAADAQAAVDEVIQRLREAIDGLAVPKAIEGKKLKQRELLHSGWPVIQP